MIIWDSFHETMRRIHKYGGRRRPLVCLVHAWLCMGIDSSTTRVKALCLAGKGYGTSRLRTINQIPVTMLLGTIWSSLTALTVGNLAIFQFFLRWIFTPYFSLPPELYNEAILSRRMAKGESFDLVIDRSFVDGYNRGIDDMKEHIKRLWGARPQVDYRTKQILFWVVRLATVAAAFSSST